MSHDSNPDRVRAVILTTQRTGSTFLVECLGSHPDIECAGEVLIGAPDTPRPQYRGRFKQLAKIANIVRSGAWRPAHRMSEYFAGGRAKVRGIKVMYNQLANPFALRFLRAHEDIRILHLHRHNLLKVHVSRLLMTKRDRVQATTPVNAVRTHVDPDQAIESMRKARRLYDDFESLFERHPRLALTYESLFDGQYLEGTTARSICDFLGVPQQPMNSKIIKLNPESLQEMVLNYDELAAAISRSEFADTLE